MRNPTLTTAAWVKDVYSMWATIGQAVDQLRTWVVQKTNVIYQQGYKLGLFAVLSPVFTRAFPHSVSKKYPCYMRVLPTIHRAYYYEDKLKKGIK